MSAAAKQVHVEQLIGRRVVDGDGRFAGRLEEVRARLDGDTCVVEEYHLGPAALVERLSAHVLSRRHARRVPWDKLDISDPDRPRLLCHPDDLERVRGGA
jgi:hypothetical protein